MNEKLDVSKTLHERDLLLESVNDKDLDPAEKDYQQILKSVNQLDLSIRESLKLNLEQDKLDYENRKLDHEIESEKEKFEVERKKSEFEMELERERIALEKSRFEFEKIKHESDVTTESNRVALEREKIKSNEKVSKWTTGATIFGVLVPAAASVVNTVFKSKYGAEVIKDSTRSTFELDKEKVQSRAANNTMTEGIKMFFGGR